MFSKVFRNGVFFWLGKKCKLLHSFCPRMARKTHWKDNFKEKQRLFFYNYLSFTPIFAISQSTLFSNPKIKKTPSFFEKQKKSPLGNDLKKLFRKKRSCATSRSLLEKSRFGHNGKFGKSKKLKIWSLRPPKPYYVKISIFRGKLQET